MSHFLDVFSYLLTDRNIDNSKNDLCNCNLASVYFQYKDFLSQGDIKIICCQGQSFKVKLIIINYFAMY